MDYHKLSWIGIVNKSSYMYFKSVYIYVHHYTYQYSSFKSLTFRCRFSIEIIYVLLNTVNSAAVQKTLLGGLWNKNNCCETMINCCETDGNGWETIRNSFCEMDNNAIEYRKRLVNRLNPLQYSWDYMMWYNDSTFKCHLCMAVGIF